MLFDQDAIVLFLALFALYSPVAALASYVPIVRHYSNAERARLAIGLFVNASAFVLMAIWIGEPLLKLLGISTAALTATGGIALILESVPLMVGKGAHGHDHGPEASSEPLESASGTATLRSVLLTPLTFPLTVGGTTFAFGVAASADVGDARGRFFLSIAAVAYGAVTGLTLYLSGRVGQRISPQGAMILDRIAGILLTAIAVILLANGFTDLVLAALARH